MIKCMVEGCDRECYVLEEWGEPGAGTQYHCWPHYYYGTDYIIPEGGEHVHRH